MCYETIEENGKNALSCKNDHPGESICFNCVKNIMEPVRAPCKPSVVNGIATVPFGLWHWDCPLCRESNCMDEVRKLAVAKGSWEKAVDLVLEGQVLPAAYLQMVRWMHAHRHYCALHPLRLRAP